MQFQRFKYSIHVHQGRLHQKTAKIAFLHIRFLQVRVKNSVKTVQSKNSSSRLFLRLFLSTLINQPPTDCSSINEYTLAAAAAASNLARVPQPPAAGPEIRSPRSSARGRRRLSRRPRGRAARERETAAGQFPRARLRASGVVVARAPRRPAEPASLPQTR